MKFLSIILFIIGLNLLNAQHDLPTCPPTDIHFFAHPNDCSQFIMCINGIRHLRTCSPNTYYDPVKERCDSVPCNNCYAHPEDEITFVADPRNCAKYYVCIGHNQTEHICSENMYFNPAVNSCDNRNNVVCLADNVTVTTTSTTTTTTSTTTTPSSVTTTPKIPELKNTTCPNLNDDTIEFLPHPEDCQWYFICVCSGSKLQACAAGLVFDINLKQCQVGGTCFLDYAPTCAPTDISFEPHPHSCEHFFICIDGEPMLQQCAPGLVFDIAQKKCDDRATSTCYSVA